MAGEGLNIPSGSGGLIRYGEDYNSRLKLKPEHVVILIVLVIAFVTGLKLFLKIPA